MPAIPLEINSTAFKGVVAVGGELHGTLAIVLAHLKWLLLPINLICWRLHLFLKARLNFLLNSHALVGGGVLLPNTPLHLIFQKQLTHVNTRQLLVIIVTH